MNEFEWRRQLRELRQPHAPRRDLWLDVERAIDAAPSAYATRSTPPAQARSRATWWFAAGLAAVTVLAVGLMHQSTSDYSRSTVAQFAARPTWKPDDPRLAGAAIELNAAQLELRQAMQQAPNSVALQRLLNRTEQQQTRLRRLGQDAG